ncbi:methylcobamide--CoM methyltransferase [Clostridium tagluense]|uniref:uroporphyrinogen decarboxylase family protein n=1 Tax=Clostridium TaxID=1485 RepID=UPI0013E962F7|nr:MULTISPECIES: uroporphyrinogen decarboxylase family protein [Clostridium]MBW9157929.1 methylcobamide--CoM methyltransferase [Clostridium tagluense]MBZ9621846.1 methylcobamide--CoM methyltransferase [Clostridium sp. FP2]MCB2312629.1 methylcobamide--CoM methyltransferase [Clostridium tagluense]MCB2317305.1 methylcobamide--CoM methyltransferase [Clostridium tagluense]MCB2322172.1 methylcobamide--CoM methyltransferase [Clostridium tagluense]
MGKIIDFNCTYDNSIGMFKEVTQKTNLQFPEAYKHWDSMTILAKELKEHDKSPFCELPFCHTVEGEAMGGSINYGDDKIGPRAKDYICTTAEEILALPEIDYSKGRISEVLKACEYLREKGENVVLYVSGPFTIMNVLIDPRHVFKIFKRNPEAMKDIFHKFQNEILRFIAEAQKSGVNMISYGDSSGGLNILGPKVSEQVVEMFTYPLLKSIEEILSNETIVLLCPKTTFALLGTDKAVWKDIQMKAPIKYAKACVEVIGKAKFIGQMCIKNKEFELKNGIIKAINLL